MNKDSDILNEINEVLDSKRELDPDRITRYLLILKFWDIIASKILMFVITLLMFLFWTYIFWGFNLTAFLLVMILHLLFYTFYIKKEFRKIRPDKEKIKSAISFFRNKKSSGKENR